MHHETNPGTNREWEVNWVLAGQRQWGTVSLQNCCFQTHSDFPNSVFLSDWTREAEINVYRSLCCISNKNTNQPTWGAIKVLNGRPTVAVGDSTKWNYFKENMHWLESLLMFIGLFYRKLRQGTPFLFENRPILPPSVAFRGLVW